MPTDLYVMTVTKNRPEFVPWLLFNFDQLKWDFGRKHLLVFIDGSGNPYREEWQACVTVEKEIWFYDDFKVSSLGEHRQHALEVTTSFAREARNPSYLTWMDDDDWQHPLRAHVPFECARLKGISPLAIVQQSWTCPTIDITQGLFKVNNKRVQWYETLVNVKLAEELPPFMPVNISEDYYWHISVERMAQAKESYMVVDWPRTLAKGPSSANLVHGRNVAGKALNAEHVGVFRLDDAESIVVNELKACVEGEYTKHLQSLSDRTQATS